MVYFFLCSQFLYLESLIREPRLCSGSLKQDGRRSWNLCFKWLSIVSQFFFILMARHVLKKLYCILQQVWPLRQLGLLMFLQKAQSYIHTYRVSATNLRFLFNSIDLLCKVACLANVKTKSIMKAQV